MHNIIQLVYLKTPPYIFTRNVQKRTKEIKAKYELEKMSSLANNS